MKQVMLCNMERRKGDVSKYVRETIEGKYQFIQLTELCSPEEMRQLKAAGVRVNFFFSKSPEHCRELVETLGCGGVRVMADESITPGGVKVLCRGGEIDATIETQLANVAASLAGMGGLFTEDVPAVPEMTESSTRP